VRVTTRGSWAESPAAWNQRVFFWGGSPDAAAILQLFSKKYALIIIFCPKFLLKNAFFKCLNKVCWCASKACSPKRVPSLDLCYATERDHFKILKYTATNSWCRLIAVRGSIFSIFPFWITILKSKWPDFARRANFFSGGRLRPLVPGWQRPCTRPLKFSGNRKSYNKQFSNVVEVTTFYGIGLSDNLDGFSAH